MDETVTLNKRLFRLSIMFKSWYDAVHMQHRFVCRLTERIEPDVLFAIELKPSEIGIPWAIIGDGEVLWDLGEKKSRQGPQGQVERILATCGQSLPSIHGDPGRNATDFAQWQQALEACGIFTLASGAEEGFERAIQTEIPSELWTRADAAFGANKVARGRFIAENYPCPTKVAELICKVLCHLQKRDANISVSSRGCP